MNLNRNANNVDRLFMQLSSGKVIQRPSDNPIVASRALRFRTNVTEVQQHQRNVAQAQSWMEVSEQNLHNITEILTRTRSELMVQGASGTHTFQNRQSIGRVAELMFQQMKTELNGTFAGRYVFSGFRTDQPPIITQRQDNVEFNIRKTVNHTNIQDAEVVFWRNPASTPPYQMEVITTHEWLNRSDRTQDANWENQAPDIGVTTIGNATSREGINILRLPYNRVYDNSTNPPTIVRDVTIPTFTDAAGNPVMTTMVGMSINGADNPFEEAFVNGIPVFIYETGELLIPESYMADFRAGNITMNYTLQGGVFQDELNPVVFFDTHRTIPGSPIGNPPTPIPVTPPLPTGMMFFGQQNQELQFEMGVNTHLTINTQARHAAPWQMFADMSSLIRWVNKVENRPDLDTNSEIAARERAFFGEQLYSKFTNSMARFDAHMQTTTTEFTALGSRMQRMEMISVRLDENEDTFRALRDENENIDYIEVLMRLNAAEAVFQAAMQIGARVNQLSLVNFI